MNKDIRILISFKNHRKRKRLKMVLGETGTDYLIDLWLTAAEDRPDGTLTGWDEIDIAIACGWNGEPQKIVQALVDTKWLDTLDDGTYVLHDWIEHNGYASSADNRSGKARFSNLKRWYPEIAKQFSDQGINSITAEQYKAITDKRPKNSATAMGADSEPMLDRCRADIGTISVTPLKQKEKESTNHEPMPDRHCTDNDRCRTDSVTDSVADRLPNPPSPSPSPAPSPTNVKNNAPLAPAGEAPSASFSKSLSKPPEHVSEKAGRFFEPIKTNCTQLVVLSRQSGKKFNPYQWVQQKLTAKGHPGAVDASLSGLIKLWESVESPWAYADSIFKTVNGNWNEKESIAFHEAMKQMPVGELQSLTHGLLKEL